jgi:molybdopterin molybdotransferase
MLKPTLVTVEEAREAVLAEASALPTEPVELDRALGRVLAEPLAAAVDVPAFDNSAMDGYAGRASDVKGASVHAPVELELVGESRAGHPAERSVGRGQAIAISTGAMLPAGADCVVRLEDTEQRDGRVLIMSAPEPGLNVRRAGEDLGAGEAALAEGTLLGPAEVGVIASVGRAEVDCHRRPTVSVLGTGDELRAPGDELEPGQIHDTNSHSVSALAALAGGLVNRPGWAGDTEAEVSDALAGALSADVAIVCGGVSVGAHDHVRTALAALGVEQRFWGVALKPGRPTWFGVREGGGLVFGLPGNPVSAIVTFLLFARPALLALAGHEADPERTTAVLDEPYPKRPGRAHAVRCRLSLAEDGWHARPTKDQGSHVLSSMIGADCLAFLPTEAESLDAGSRVEVMLLPKPPLRGKMVDR